MIAGVTGQEPVGAALKIGIKSDRGFPTEKDRFHITLPRETPDGRCPPHPSFGWWAELPPEKRRVVRGVLVGPWDRMLRQQYMAYLLPGGQAPPGKRPACTGDGVSATRFSGQKGADDFRAIACPGEACPYRSRPTGKDGRPMREPCTPSTTLLFRLSFTPEVMDRFRPPTPVVRFASKGWRTYRAILGLREHLDRAAADLGLTTYNPAGFDFTLTLTEAKGAGTRYPVVEVSPQVSAHDFLMSAAQRRVLPPSPTLIGITETDIYEGHRATLGG